MRENEEDEQALDDELQLPGGSRDSLTNGTDELDDQVGFSEKFAKDCTRTQIHFRSSALSQMHASILLNHQDYH